MYLIHGYLGYGNYGDELLASLVRKYINSEEIQSLSSKNSLFEHIGLICGCKEMICLGGLFQDKTSIRSVFYYSLTILLARFFNKKIKILAQGIGPLDNFISRFISRFALRSADFVSVRDKESSIQLEDWKIDHYYGSDLAWLLNSNQEKLDGQSKLVIDNLFADMTEAEKMEKLVVLSLRDQKKQDSHVLVEKIIDQLDTDMPVMILQMQDDDFGIHSILNDLDSEKRKPRRIYFLDAQRFKAEELVYILKTYAKSMIGMRLHALILAKLANLEILAIDCDPKIRAFAHQVDVYNLEELEERARKHFVKAGLPLT